MEADPEISGGRSQYKLWPREISGGRSWIHIDKPHPGFTDTFNWSIDKRKPSYNLNGRRPQIIKCEISPQPLVGSSPNFTIKLMGLNYKNASNEDDLQ